MHLSWGLHGNPLSFQAQGYCAKARCLHVISHITHKFLHVFGGSLIHGKSSEESEIPDQRYQRVSTPASSLSLSASALNP